MSTQEIHVRQLCAIAEILLGVAYADRRFEADEYDVIREILTTFTHLDELPSSVVDAVSSFEAETFDLREAIERLEVSDDNRLPLLRMILRVADADRVRAPEEQHYFHAVARRIGVAQPHIQQLLDE